VTQSIDLGNEACFLLQQQRLYASFNLLPDLQMSKTAHVNLRLLMATLQARH